MNKLLFIFSFLFSLFVQAAGHKVYDATFGGSRISGYIHNWTIAEYSGEIDPSTGYLIDKSGVRTLPNGQPKPQHDLAPTGAPTTAISTLRKQDGNYWRGRSFDGATQYYSRTHHVNFNIFDGDFTITVVFLSPTTAAGTDSIIQHSSVLHDGATLYVGQSGDFALEIDNDSLVPVYKTISTPAIYHDGKYHVGQVVRKSNKCFVSVDGTRTASVDVTGYGKDGTRVVYLGGLGTYTGNIAYFRLDAEALPDEVLEFERQALMGYASSTSMKVPPAFVRASAGYTNVQGNLHSRMNNAPRIQTDGSILIEEGRTNYMTYSNALNQWTKLNAGDSFSTTNTTPETTADGYGIIGAAANVDHGITRATAALTAVNHTLSFYAKQGTHPWVYFADTTVATATGYFDLSRGKFGTLGAGWVITPTFDTNANGWYRIKAPFLGTVATHTIQLSPADADLDKTTTGDGASTMTAMWNVQVEAGSHATSPITTAAVTAARAADDYTAIPWELNVNAIRTGTETWWTDFSSDVATTGTVSLGGKTFTQVGDTKHVYGPDLGHRYDFDGTGDYLTIADNSFNPAGSFSVALVLTPSVLTAVTTYMMAVKAGNVGDVGWYIYAYGDGIYFEFSKTGTGTNYTSKATSLTVGKTSLITFTYTYSGHPDLSDSRLDIYVDGLVVASKTDCYGPVYASSAAFSIGAKATGLNAYNGKLHFLSFHNGTVLTQAQHNTAYANFKKGGILPLTISSTSARKKLYVEFEARAEWSGSTNIGVTRSLLEIGGLTGVSAATRNRLLLYFSTATSKFYATVYSNGTIEHSLVSNAADPIDFSKWHRYQYYFDATNLANSYLKVDGSTTGFTATVGTMTGATTLYLQDTKIRLGQGYASNINGNSEIKNVRILTYE